MRKTIFGLVLCSLVFLVACGADPNRADYLTNVRPGLIGSVIDYGNGVYYFDKRQADFANALSTFLTEHDCKVEAIAGDSDGLGMEMGYFVVCR